MGQKCSSVAPLWSPLNIGVLRNFTGKHQCQGLFFDTVSGLQQLTDIYIYVHNFINKRFQNRCFRVNIAKFLRTPILKNLCERLQVWKFIKKENLAQVFSCEVCEICKDNFFYKNLWTAAFVH